MSTSTDSDLNFSPPANDYHVPVMFQEALDVH